MNEPLLTKNQYFGMYLVKGDEIFSDDRILPDKYDKLYFNSFTMMNFTKSDEQMINIDIPHEHGIAQRPCRIEYCKLILIPMSELNMNDIAKQLNQSSAESIEWLIKNKYDYFNLIERGWAIKK